MSPSISRGGEAGRWPTFGAFSHLPSGHGGSRYSDFIPGAQTLGICRPPQKHPAGRALFTLPPRSRATPFNFGGVHASRRFFFEFLRRAQPASRASHDVTQPLPCVLLHEKQHGATDGRVSEQVCREPGEVCRERDR